MRYEFYIAKRYLRPQGDATFIFRLILISVIGVALGVAALITVLSVMNGFGNDMRKKMLLGESHIVLTFPDGLQNYDKIIPNYLPVKNVIACSPVIKRLGALYPTDFMEDQPNFINFIGIDPDLEQKVTELDKKIVAGSMDGLRQEFQTKKPSQKIKITDVVQKKKAGIIIGKELAFDIFRIPDSASLTKEQIAEKYQEILGQQVTIIAMPETLESISLGSTKSKTFVIEGIFDSGLYQYDIGYAYISIPSAQYLVEMADKISQIQIRLQDYSENGTDITKNDIFYLNRTLGIGCYTQSWMALNRTYYEALAFEKRTMNWILNIIIFVATFNILATVFMLVTQKTRDIGLLRAIGAGRSSIMYIFIFLGLIIGILGAGSGMTVGFILCKIIQLVHISLPGGGRVYYLPFLPCEMQMMDFIWVSLYTVLVSFLASLYPATRASKLVPVEALRFS